MVEPTLSAPTFQSTIMALERFWSSYGCLIWQPHNHQVGAGTMNPATALRVLGPEPWKVSYVEPSIRPDDGRYGDNPNRLQQHYQYQVILQPAPIDPQEIYLHSLAKIGIDPALHDIRFVEDDWESPTLGAWGLGWEVWLDGMEITQFTYFQQAGGMDLAPITGEITYGLERLDMYLQDVDDVYDLEWSPGVSYRDVRYRDEVEGSRFSFDEADVVLIRRNFEESWHESERLLKAGLVLPAYEYCLKCSHLFNTLDARGAVSVNERMAMILKVRDLACAVAKVYTNAFTDEVL